jgi:hypothetical protein
MHSFDYHNRLRYSLLEQIRSLKAKGIITTKSPEAPLYTLLYELLWWVESFDYQSFVFESEQDAFTEIVQSLEPSENLQQIVKQIRKDLKNKLACPIIPARRLITKQEWEQIWANFEIKLKPQKRSELLETDSHEFQFIADFMMQEVDLMYLTSDWDFRYSFELSGKWFQEMFALGGGHWIAKDFQWAVAGDGCGFARVWGTCNF